MKRLLVRIFAFLLLGAIVNIAVAWGCIGRHRLGTDTYFKARMWWESAERWVTVDQVADTGYVILGVHGYAFSDTSSAAVRPMPAWSRIGEQVVAMPSPDHRYVKTRAREYAAGWPSLALSGALTTNATYVNGDVDHASSSREMEHAFRRFGTGSDERALPYRPIWPGFALNTMFYAVILWGLFAAPFTLRRRLRIERGLCAKCAYDLRGSESQTCPECVAPR